MLKLLASFVLILYTTFVATHSQVVQPNVPKRIHNTCLETSHYDECLKYLTDDPKSSTADVHGLALIMVNVMKSKANVGVEKINQLIGSSSPDQNVALKSCADKYNAIIAVNIPQATESLQKKSSKLAMDSALNASDVVSDCEDGFSGKSPLTTENLVMDRVSAITAQICRQLVLGGQ
ncbi:unnamed protein product [Lathyrus sativus]|nr:unnamed protein product [Lathyrus sativus]